MFSDLRYGVAFTFEAPILKAGASDYAINTDWTPAAGDVQVIIDGGTPANIGTLPTYISSGNIWQFTLTAAEMSGSRISIVIVDSATKAVEDQMFPLLTEAHNRQIVTITDVTPLVSGFDTDLTDTVDDLHDGAIAKFITGNLSGKVTKITAYDGTTTIGKITLTVSGDLAIPIAPANGDKLILMT